MVEKLNKLTKSDKIFFNSIVILGSKPGAKLPAVEASVVLTANAAVELGVEYRIRYNSYIVSLAGSGELKNREYVQKAVSQSYPDEIVVIGEKINKPVDFIKENLGLINSRITLLSFFDRYQLMAKRVGPLAPIVGMKSINSRVLYKALMDIIGSRTMNWSFCSTGVTAISYAVDRYPNAKQFITAGIGLQGGSHFYGVGDMTKGRAKVDRRVMKLWKKEERSNVYTTDEAMSEIGNVPLWEGEVFYFDSLK